jgi:hypothetical protein
MNEKIDTKISNSARNAVEAVLKKYRLTWRQLYQSNILLAWDGMGGIWKNKKVPNASVWQRKIRRELDRKSS